MSAFWEDISFQHPWLLCLSLLCIWAYWVQSRVTMTVLFSTTKNLPTKKTWRMHLQWIPPLFSSLCVLGLTIALAIPQLPDAEQSIESQGISIMMVMDTSGSMAAVDLDPSHKQSRLDVVKQVFGEFVAARKNDEIGLVTFAAFADTRSPLSLDRVSLISLVEDVELVTSGAEAGTNLAAGIDVATIRLFAAKGQSKIIIFLTDGVHTVGDQTPASAAQFAKQKGIKIYTIGAGTNGLAPTPVQDPFTGRTVLRPTRVEIDEATLQSIAKVTGGQYFRATDKQALRKIYEKIDALERSKLQGTSSQKMISLAEWPLAFGGVCGLFSFLLGLTVLRRYPS